MILKGSQRAGGGLTAHLLSERDNDHVRVLEVRGFAASDLGGALAEADAISRGTRCKQFLFSLSLNPPKGAVAGEEDFERAADAAERKLGLVGQPRAIVLHEKEGRRHAHVVWSRIDPATMRAINLPHYKLKLASLSRELFLEHGWSLPEGLRTNGGRSPLNFTLEEWQQAKRLSNDPREIKDTFRDAWSRSDSLPALSHALEERGYFLAQGDRRGLVAINVDGEVFSVARYAGIKTRELREKLGELSALPSVGAVKGDLNQRVTAQLKTFIGELRARHADQSGALREKLKRVTAVQAEERERLDGKQAQRWAEETQARAARLRTGLAGLWDRLSGKARAIMSVNEAEALTALHRDRAQRDQLVIDQLKQREPIQRQVEELRRRHAQERLLMAREVAQHLKRRRAAAIEPSPENDLAIPPARTRRRLSPSLDL